MTDQETAQQGSHHILRDCGDRPWRDEQVMRDLYVEEKMSQNEIADALDCGPTTVATWLGKHGIETRSISEGQKLKGKNYPTFYTIESRGYEAINTSYENAYVHRLQAVAYWGFDALRDKHVHHIDGIEWHNAEYNLELIDPSNHSRLHNGDYSEEDEERAVELYRSGLSSYDVADEIGCSANTVINWVRKHEPTLVRNNRGETA